MFWWQEAVNSGARSVLLPETGANICEFVFWFQCKMHYKNMESVLWYPSEIAVYSDSESSSNQRKASMRVDIQFQKS